LHQHPKPGFLRFSQPESPDFPLKNSVSQVLLRMVQDVRLVIFAVLQSVVAQATQDFEC
jgi:hypothetical protein